MKYEMTLTPDLRPVRRQRRWVRAGNHVFWLSEPHTSAIGRFMKSVLVLSRNLRTFERCPAFTCFTKSCQLFELKTVK